MIKLTDEVSLADAGVMYASGLGSLSAYDAARLLNDSWDLEVSREDGTSLRVRYADFGASSVEEAVQRAIEAEGLADAGIDESGVDESGNTYAAGTIGPRRHDLLVACLGDTAQGGLQHQGPALQHLLCWDSHERGVSSTQRLKVPAITRFPQMRPFNETSPGFRLNLGRRFFTTGSVRNLRNPSMKAIEKKTRR